MLQTFNIMVKYKEKVGLTDKSQAQKKPAKPSILLQGM